MTLLDESLKPDEELPLSPLEFRVGVWVTVAEPVVTATASVVLSAAVTATPLEVMMVVTTVARWEVTTSGVVMTRVAVRVEEAPSLTAELAEEPPELDEAAEDVPLETALDTAELAWLLAADEAGVEETTTAELGVVEEPAAAAEVTAEDTADVWGEEVSAGGEVTTADGEVDPAGVGETMEEDDSTCAEEDGTVDDATAELEA